MYACSCRDAHDDAAETIKKAQRSEVEELKRALDVGEQRLEISERQRMREREAAREMEEQLGREAADREQRVRTEMEALIATLDRLKRGGVVDRPPEGVGVEGRVGSVLHAMDEEIEQVARSRLRASSPRSGGSGCDDSTETEHGTSDMGDKRVATAQGQELRRVEEAGSGIHVEVDGTIEIWQHSPAYPALQGSLPPTPAGWGLVGAVGGVEPEERQRKREGAPLHPRVRLRPLPPEQRGGGGKYLQDESVDQVDVGGSKRLGGSAETLSVFGKMPAKQQEMVDFIAATLAYNDLSPLEGFRLFDRDGDGKVGYEDLLLSLVEMPISVSHPDINALLCLLDRDRDGFVSEADWRAAIAAAHPESVLIDVKAAAAEEQRLKAEWEVRRLEAENTRLRQQIRQHQALLASTESKRADLEKVVKSRAHVERDLKLAHSDRLAMEQVLHNCVTWMCACVCPDREAVYVHRQRVRDGQNDYKQHAHGAGTVGSADVPLRCRCRPHLFDPRLCLEHPHPVSRQSPGGGRKRFHRHYFHCASGCTVLPLPILV